MDRLSNLWDLLSENAFVGALASGLALAALLALLSWIRRCYRRSVVYRELSEGLIEKNKSFLPTSYISAKTGYTQSQVEALCSSHSKISRNEKELESWKVIK